MTFLDQFNAPPSAPASKPKKPKNARHSKENPNWETPSEDIELARVALGGHIDLDVFSCARANARVGAGDFLGPDHPNPARRDGFTAPWIADAIFENHPGGTTKRAWAKTCAEYHAQHYQQLVWIGFSVEQLCILSSPNEPGETNTARWARGDYRPTDFSVCFLRQRIHFIDGDRPDRPDRPGHANFTLYIGPDPDRFERVYAPYGQVMHGELARRFLGRREENPTILKAPDPSAGFSGSHDHGNNNP